MQRPRTVLHLLNGAAGGAAMSTIAQAESLLRQGIESVAVCHDGGSTEERERLREAMGGKLAFTRLYWRNRKIRMARWKRPLFEAKQIVETGWTLGSAARVAEAAARWNADLIHTNTILTPEGGMAAHRLGIPHVWHLRELVGPGNPFRFAREGAAFGRSLARYCSKLVANSHTSAAQIQGWLPPGLLEVVPNGIDIDRFQPHVPFERPDRIVVGMVGNLTSRTKKHSLFIAAAALVDRSLPIEWRIYGHDPSRGGSVPADAYIETLHALVKQHSLADRFAWPGFVADPVNIMAELDVLVHPADNESFGRVAVEAMAAGLPVVGVRGGGVSEIVEPGVTGLLANQDDPQDLAGAIEQLARDHQRARQFGAAGRRRAVDNYSLAACAAGILAVYEMAMERPLGRARQPLGAISA